MLLEVTLLFLLDLQKGLGLGQTSSRRATIIFSISYLQLPLLLEELHLTSLLIQLHLQHLLLDCPTPQTDHQAVVSFAAAVVAVVVVVVECGVSSLPFDAISMYNQSLHPSSHTYSI